MRRAARRERASLRSERSSSQRLRRERGRADGHEVSAPERPRSGLGHRRAPTARNGRVALPMSASVPSPDPRFPTIPRVEFPAAGAHARRHMRLARLSAQHTVNRRRSAYSTVQQWPVVGGRLLKAVRTSPGQVNRGAPVTYAPKIADRELLSTSQRRCRDATCRDEDAAVRGHGRRVRRAAGLPCGQLLKGTMTGRNAGKHAGLGRLSPPPRPCRPRGPVIERTAAASAMCAVNADGPSIDLYRPGRHTLLDGAQRPWPAVTTIGRQLIRRLVSWRGLA